MTIFFNVTQVYFNFTLNLFHLVCFIISVLSCLAAQKQDNSSRFFLNGRDEDYEQKSKKLQ